MARVTVEDCLAHIPNRFALTILASRRARSLSESRGRPLVECDNKEGVTALREISTEKVRFREDVEQSLNDFIEEQRRQLRVTTGEHTFLEAASLRALEEEDVEDEEVADEDVEELDTDPEVLGEQAKGKDDEDSDDDDSNDSTDDEDVDSSDDFEGDAPFDDEDLPESDDDSDDNASDDDDED